MLEPLQSQLAALKELVFLPIHRQQLISLIDLTSLHETDTEASIAVFCKKAVTPYGKVAAFCSYPRFVKQVATILKGSGIKVATVVNFPDGVQPLDHVLREIIQSINAGADEIDVVFPYPAYLAGARAYCASFISQCKAACPKQTLKVILETGAISDWALIADAAEMAIFAGADFVKTSTGKHAIGASLEAVAAILLTIQTASQKIKRPVGLKVSGGIREPQQAWQYLALAETIMGINWANPRTFRIGASQLLDKLIQLG